MCSFSLSLSHIPASWCFANVGCAGSLHSLFKKKTTKVFFSQTMHLVFLKNKNKVLKKQLLRTLFFFIYSHEFCSVCKDYVKRFIMTFSLFLQSKKSFVFLLYCQNYIIILLYRIFTTGSLSKWWLVSFVNECTSNSYWEIFFCFVFNK